MKTRHAAALLAALTIIFEVPVHAAPDSGGGLKPKFVGDWVVWQGADGTVGDVLPAGPLASEPNLVAATEDLLTFFNAAIGDGSLTGTGGEPSAAQRATALYNKLVAAQALSAGEDYAAALTALDEVYQRCDGRPEPNDFVAGDSRAAFAAMVQARIALLEPLAFAARGDYVANDGELGPGVQAASSLPTGSHDAVNQNSTLGWTCDADDYARPLSVHFYMDGPAGGGGIFIGSTTANVSRPDVASACGGTASHGFNFTLPAALKDGDQHWIYAYAIDIGGGANPLLANSPKLFTRWQAMGSLAVLGDSITRAYNANGDQAFSPSCSWGDDLRYSWFSNTGELGQCTEHNVFSVAERTWCTGASPLAVGNFAWNGAEMYTDAYDQAVSAKSWLASQGSNRLVAILLGGNDLCTNTVNVNQPCANDPTGRLDNTNHCRPKPATFEREVRRALDVLVTVPNAHIGVADPPRVSLLCRAKDKSVGSNLRCSNIWQTATLFGASGVCRSVTQDCSPARIAKANEAFVNYRNAIQRVVAEYAAVAPGAKIPANAAFGTGNVVKAPGVSLKRSEVFGKYLFESADINNCDCFHPYKTTQNKLAAWMFRGLQCSPTEPCVREVGDNYQDGAGLNRDTSTYYSGLLDSKALTFVGFWRPSTGQFYLDTDGSFAWTAGVDRITDPFGVSTDRPVIGDWNGDGADDIGVWRPSTGRFYLDMDGSRTWTPGVDLISDPFGIPSDLPVAGDWNGDGLDDIGVWRPSTGRFYLDSNGSRTWNTGVDRITDPFGLPADQPVAGDWNGDGIADIGVRRPSTGRFYLDSDGSRTWTAGVDLVSGPFGIATDEPVTGDWNGEGFDDIGFWRPSTGRFALDMDGSRNWTPGIDLVSEPFGAGTDRPVAGRWQNYSLQSQ